MQNNAFHNNSRPIPKLNTESSTTLSKNGQKSESDYMPVSRNTASIEPVPDSEPEEFGEVVITKNEWENPEKIILNQDESAEVSAAIKVIQESEYKRLFIQAFSKYEKEPVRKAGKRVELFLKENQGKTTLRLSINEDLPDDYVKNKSKAEYWFTTEHWDGVEVTESQKILLPHIHTFDFIEVPGPCFHLGSVIPVLENTNSLKSTFKALADYKAKADGPKVVVLGHTDSSGEFKVNYDIGELRAKSVHALIENSSEAWKIIAKANGKVIDYQAILSNLDAKHGWDCNPGTIDGIDGKNTQAALKKFQKQANEKHKLSLVVDGIIGPNTWNGLFVTIRSIVLPNHKNKALALCYREEVEKGCFSCGESFPRKKVNQEDNAEESNRRVDIVFSKVAPILDASAPSSGKMTAKHCGYYADMCEWVKLGENNSKNILSIEFEYALNWLNEWATSKNDDIAIKRIDQLFGGNITEEQSPKWQEGLSAFHKDILNHAVAIPEIEIVDQIDTGSFFIEGLAAYRSKDKTILIQRDLVEEALGDEFKKNLLFLALCEETGHYIDDLLRNHYTNIGGDAPQDEGAEFASFLFFSHAFLNESSAEYAKVSSDDNKDSLNYSGGELQKTFDEYFSQERTEADHKTKELEFFGAGNPKLQGMHTHKSIEQAALKKTTTPNSLLTDSFKKKNGKAVFADTLNSCPTFEERDLELIYFGNWLRDFSQIVDPNFMKTFGLSRNFLSKVVRVLSQKDFGKHMKVNSKDFEFTNEELGGYRPEEHIDNPHGIENASGVEKRADGEPLFRNAFTKEEIAVNSNSKLKNYIATENKGWATSSGYIEQELKSAFKLGRTAQGYRHFGQALHTLEDFYAHSNFCEVLLTKVGKYVNCWTGLENESNLKVEDLPVVTGKFGSTDIQVSLGLEVADILQKNNFKNYEPGKRSAATQIAILFVYEKQGEKAGQKFENAVLQYEAILQEPIIGSALQFGHHMVDLMIRNVLKYLDEYFGDLFRDQIHDIIEEQNKGASSPGNPTHSQVGKDHMEHPLQDLAAQLAGEMVQQMGMAMRLTWNGKMDIQDTVALAKSYLVHPKDLNSFDSLAQNWSDANKDKIIRAIEDDWYHNHDVDPDHLHKKRNENSKTNAKDALNDHIDALKNLYQTFTDWLGS